MVLAHALKWPPVVRHFREYLRGHMGPRSPLPTYDTILVDAFYDAVKWAGGKPFAEMHSTLSIAGRAHALTGVAVTAAQMGLTTSAKPHHDNYKEITLGPASRVYYLLPRELLTDSERVVAKYIDHATTQALCWPKEGSSLNTFACKVSLLMISCHSEKFARVGLKGGKCLQKELKSKAKTPRTGCQPGSPFTDATARTKNVGKSAPKAPPYVVPHITRHFILAADKLNVFDYEALRYTDIEEHMPDVTMQAVPMVGNHSLAEIKHDFGLDPFHLSCHLCFAKQLSEDDLRAVLALPFGALYDPIGTYIRDKLAEGLELETNPPNLYSVLKLLALKANAAATPVVDAGLGGGAMEESGLKRHRKSKPSAAAKSALCET